MSIKSEPHRKFVQTFVLAEQPNGYYVLNDIIRYLNDDEEDLPEEEPLAENTGVQPEEEHTAGTQEPEFETKGESVDEPAAADEVDAKLEQEIAEEVTEGLEEAPDANGTPPSDIVEDRTAPSSGPEEPGTTTAEHSESTGDQATLEPEFPKEPEHTPSISPPKPTTPAPAQDAPPAAPAKAAPKTWANLVAANRAAPPAIPSPSSSSPAPSQTKAASNSPQPSTPPSGVNENTTSQTSQGNGSGWQTAGHDHGKRQNRQQSISSGAGEEGNVLGYVKNVTEKVDATALRAALSKYGKLKYFDVSRPRVSIIFHCH